jgi:hypothetical protein
VLSLFRCSRAVRCWLTLPSKRLGYISWVIVLTGCLVWLGFVYISPNSLLCVVFNIPPSNQKVLGLHKEKVVYFRRRCALPLSLLSCCPLLAHVTFQKVLFTSPQIHFCALFLTSPLQIKRYLVYIKKKLFIFVAGVLSLFRCSRAVRCWLTLPSKRFCLHLPKFTSVRCF